MFRGKLLVSGGCIVLNMYSSKILKAGQAEWGLSSTDSPFFVPRTSAGFGRSCCSTLGATEGPGRETSKGPALELRKKNIQTPLGVQRPWNIYILEKTMILVGIYNQQFQGTIFLMVFYFQGNLVTFHEILWSLEMPPEFLDPRKTFELEPPKKTTQKIALGFL